MRHRNPISTSYFSFHRGASVDKPYCASSWKFSHPSPKCKYIQVVKYIAEHPRCTRKEIQQGVWNISGPGYQSALFAVLLWRDFIDYDPKTFKYKTTYAGVQLLKKAGIKELTITVKAYL